MADRKDGVATAPEFRRFLFDVNPQPMWVFDPLTLAILDANAAAAAHSGYERDSLRRLTMTDLLAPGQEESMRDAVARTLRDAKAGRMTDVGMHRHRRRDGRPADLEMWWGVVERGGSAAILALGHDVTERNFAEQALWASEAQMRAILDTALDAIVLMDSQGLILSWNPRAESVFGWTRTEAVGRLLADMIVPPRYREAHVRGVQRYLETGEGTLLNRPVELSALRRDGSEFPVALRVTALREVDRVVFCAFIEDISERKRIQEAVLASEKRYRALFEGNPLPVLLYEPDTLRILAVNSAAVRHYGYSEWEFKDRSLPDLWAPEAADTAGEEPGERGARHRTQDGRVFDVDVTAQAIEYAGRPARIAVVQDVTERKQAQDRVARAERLLSNAQRITHIGSWQWDVGTTQITWSDELYRIYGLAPQEVPITYADFLSRVHEEDRERVQAAVSEVVERGGGFAFDERIVRPDGSVRVLLSQGEAIRNGSGRTISLLGTCLDVTERRVEEERQRQAEERFEKAFRSSPAAISITTLSEGRFLDVNDAFVRLTGWRREQVVGRTSMDLGTWIDAAERGQFVSRIVREGAVRRMPVRLRGADGNERHLVVSGELIDLAGERCVLALTEEVVL
jgi:PAS domain S-box-containing protein